MVLKSRHEHMTNTDTRMVFVCFFVPLCVLHTRTFPKTTAKLRSDTCGKKESLIFGVILFLAIIYIFDTKRIDAVFFVCLLLLLNSGQTKSKCEAIEVKAELVRKSNVYQTTFETKNERFEQL